MARFKKSDVEFHRLGYGSCSAPAVNVKVYRSWHDGFREFVKSEKPESQFTQEWVEEHCDEERLESEFSFACEMGWEDIDSYAKELWGNQAKVYSEGRSGGWAYVEHGPDHDVSAWDAIELSRWHRFATYARSCADDIPYKIVDSIYYNHFLPWQEEQRQDEEERRESVSMIVESTYGLEA